MGSNLDSEIQKALYGRRKGARIRVKEDPADRTADGIVFHSGHEMDVYLQFKSLLRAGTFTDMKRQVRFPIYAYGITANPIKVCDWIADFVVKDLQEKEHVYDAKGMQTEIYKLKKKFVEAQYGIRIIEV